MEGPFWEWGGAPGPEGTSRLCTAGGGTGLLLSSEGQCGATEAARPDDLIGQPWGAGTLHSWAHTPPTRVSSPAGPLCLWYPSPSLPPSGGSPSITRCLTGNETKSRNGASEKEVPPLCSGLRAGCQDEEKSLLWAFDQDLPSILCAGGRDITMGRQHPAKAASWPGPPGPRGTGQTAPGRAGRAGTECPDAQRRGERFCLPGLQKF